MTDFSAVIFLLKSRFLPAVKVFKKTVKKDKVNEVDEG